MIAILLLGGVSRRFWPLGDKMLFPLCGTTLLEHQVASLQRAGCRDILLVGRSHNITAARSLFPKLTVIEQTIDQGMQGALRAALPSVGNGPVLIVSGNDVVDVSAYKNVIDALKKSDIDGAILAKRVKNHFPGGYLTLKGTRITGIVEKPAEGKEPSEWVNIVVHAHRDGESLLHELTNVTSQWDDGYEVTLDARFGKKHYELIPYEGAWQPVKYPWHLLDLLPTFLENIQKKIPTSATIHPTAVVEGVVRLGESVRILPHATVVGPCTIGDHTVIGTGALVRGSSIGRHCVVGYNTEVKSSILADHVWTHSTYLGDSIVSRNVSFGGGCTTGNFRLDEGEILSAIGDAPVKTGRTKLGAMIGEGCRLGIQVGTNPGLKIGSHVFVAGGAFVLEDIPDGCFARMKEGKIALTENRTRAPSPDEREVYLQKISENPPTKKVKKREGKERRKR